MNCQKYVAWIYSRHPGPRPYDLHKLNPFFLLIKLFCPPVYYSMGIHAQMAPLLKPSLVWCVLPDTNSRCFYRTRLITSTLDGRASGHSILIVANAQENSDVVQ